MTPEDFTHRHFDREPLHLLGSETVSEVFSWDKAAAFLDMTTSGRRRR
jgi:hypothetical protein